MRLLIDGFPRTGTTTLARLLAIHPDTRVIVEPFHPKRYNSWYLDQVQRDGVAVDFDFVWKDWNVVKHVWEPGSIWPLRDFSLQSALWQSATTLIVMTRRNMTRRYVSAQISIALQFWIGKREDFLARLESISLLPINLDRALAQLHAERAATQRRDEALAQLAQTVILLDYEDLYELEQPQQLALLRALFSKLELAPLRPQRLRRAAQRWLDPAENKWATDAVYERIPNWKEVQETLDVAGFGSLMGK